MERVNLAVMPAPRLPRLRARGRALACAAACALHTAFAGGAFVLSRVIPMPPSASQHTSKTESARQPDMTHVVFLPAPLVGAVAGGGGGGNEHPAPIRRASGIGHDAVTLRVRKPAAASDVSRVPVESMPALVLDATPLAAGTFDQVGLPGGGVLEGDSTGPGSGGGVGSGVGTGIGPGRGPGMGPGEGGGTGGGVYRPGGSVTVPRVLSEVSPRYTPEALARRIQGTVVLAIVVRSDGCASDIHVTRSLDAGLDQQAVLAVGQWRFAPGRLAGLPVDVIASVVVDFTIR